MDTPFALCAVVAPPAARRQTSYQVVVRVVSRIAEPAPTCNAPHVALAYWREHIETAPWFDPDKEHLVVLMLDTKFQVRAWNLVSVGSLTESIAHPREIFRPAIATGAYAILILHNHPSGIPSPSLADEKLTRRLKDAGELLSIPLQDHVIVGAGDNYHSFRSHNAL